MRTVAGKVLAEVEKAFIGKEDVTRSVLLAMIAGGHVLLEDVPGVGKNGLSSDAVHTGCHAVRRHRIYHIQSCDK